MKKCESINEISEIQKQSLIQTINESNLNEKKRQLKLLQLNKSFIYLNKIKNTSSSNYFSYLNKKEYIEKLNERYNNDRNKEKEKINHLVDDLKSITNIIKNNNNEINLKERNENYLNYNSFKINLNCSERIIQPEDHTFYKEEYNKLSHIDKRAQNRNVERFDEYAEKKKLILLKQKRDVIHKLVTIQRNALEGVVLPDINQHRSSSASTFTSYNNNRNNNSNNNSNNNNRKWSDTSSVASSRTSSSRSSNASYATFAPPPSNNYKQPKLAIPKLNISSSSLSSNNNH